MSPPRLLFVCTGNICRSPTAEAIFRHQAALFGLDAVCDSAGTSAEELGNPPDRRARQAAARRGYELPDRRARRIRADDFHEFDRILAMTTGHLRTLETSVPAMSGGRPKARLERFMDHAPGRGVIDVPDPWYGDSADFERVLDLIEAGVAGLIQTLEAGR